MNGRPHGFALVTVMAALALIALVATQFAGRMEEHRKQVAASRAEADARLRAAGGLARTLHWIVTQPGGPDGFGEGVNRVVADGRFYKQQDGTLVAVLDQRALISLNMSPRDLLGRLLTHLGASPGERDTLLDVLADYTDRDSLRRLNGAEAPEYERLGLRAPRNDWLVAVQELGQMPGWADRPDWVRAMSRYGSTRRTGVLNPNLMPLGVLRAAFPEASPEQLTLFDTLRRASPFANGVAARQASGLPVAGDEFLFHTSDEVAVLVWAPGMPRAVQYQVWLTPADPLAPWTITEVHAVDPPPADHAAPPFPTAPVARRDARGF